MFQFFNAIWKDERKNLTYGEHCVNARTYRCIAMGPDFGCIELIPNCKTLKDVKQLHGTLNENGLANLVTSAAGSYIAAFVMGIRDRHYDNVLLQPNGTLFQYDFICLLFVSYFVSLSKSLVCLFVCVLIDSIDFGYALGYV